MKEPAGSCRDSRGSEALNSTLTSLSEDWGGHETLCSLGKTKVRNHPDLVEGSNSLQSPAYA